MGAERQGQARVDVTEPSVKSALDAKLPAYRDSFSVDDSLATNPTKPARPTFRGLSHELLAAQSAGFVIQPKLTIGAPGDPYEQEADRLAKQVVQQLHTPPSARSPQPKSAPNQTENLQRKPAPAPSPATGALTASAELESAIHQTRSSGQPIPNSIREPMERSLDADFSSVRVHTDATADQLNRSIQAKAFTAKQDIFFRRGTYAPGSLGGQELIAHELTHVMQQNGAKVKAHPALDNTVSKQSFPSEKETSLTTPRTMLSTGDAITIQRVKIKTDTYECDATSLDILNELHKRFIEIAAQDSPLTPTIESTSNEGSANRLDANALGKQWELSSNPLIDFWRIAMEFKKSRTQGVIDISLDDKPFASAIYNQYGKTQAKPENDDVMIYKAPPKKDEIKQESDKGVSYDLAATKFEEIAKKTAMSEKEIAQALLDFYKTKKVPDSISANEELLRNFGYLATLMTVPETKRDVGTFPLGLIMLDNIASGATVVAAAFKSSISKEDIETRKSDREEHKRLDKEIKALETPSKKSKSKKVKSEDEDKDLAEKKKELEEQRDEITVVPAYKDAIDQGGLYAPAYSGSKSVLNTMESQTIEGKSLKPKVEESQNNYYWNTTINRYAKMLEIFLDKHLGLCNLGDRADITSKEAAIKGLIDNLLINHFMVSPEILQSNTSTQAVRRARNTTLSSLSMTLDPENYGTPPTKGKLIESGTKASRSIFNFGSKAEKSENQETLDFAEEYMETTSTAQEDVTDSVGMYPIAPNSPTRKFSSYVQQSTKALHKVRKQRKDSEKKGDVEGAKFLTTMQENWQTGAETELNFGLNMLETVSEQKKRSKGEDKQPEETENKKRRTISKNVLKKQTYLNYFQVKATEFISFLIETSQNMDESQCFNTFIDFKEVKEKIQAAAVNVDGWTQDQIKATIKEIIAQFYVPGEN